MDPATNTLLSMDPVSLDDIVAKIRQVHDDVKGSGLTPETLSRILVSIDKRFYGEKFIPHITSAEFPTILVTDTGRECLDTDAFLEALAYEDGDPEWAHYRYGFKAALTCLRDFELSPEEVFYSGGFQTRDKLMFIILMILHESLHIVEYADSLLTQSPASHTIFFYKEAYRRFGIISRLSQVTKKTDINRSVSARIAAILALQDTLTEDGIEPLVDHSHYMRGKKRVFLGYFAHPISPLEPSGGGRRHRTYRRRRQHTRRKKSKV